MDDGWSGDGRPTSGSGWGGPRRPGRDQQEGQTDEHEVEATAQCGVSSGIAGAAIRGAMVGGGGPPGDLHTGPLSTALVSDSIARPDVVTTGEQGRRIR